MKHAYFLRKIVGDSMLPTLKPGQLVVIMRRPQVGIGDIVMIRHDNVEKIKRVARVEPGRVYVLGDNPDASTDSRHFGWVGLESVRGTLVWPRKKSAAVQ